jgi:S1-C subfamily serine protease
VRLFTGGRGVVQAGPTRAPAREEGTSDARSAWRPLTPYLVGANRVAGAELRPLDERLGVYFGAERGLLVTDVAEGTPGYASGLRAGDVLRFVDGREVTSVGQVRTTLAGARGPVELRILRRGRTLELVLPR